jgi:hypothetical protein
MAPWSRAASLHGEGEMEPPHIPHAPRTLGTAARVPVGARRSYRKVLPTKMGTEE